MDFEYILCTLSRWAVLVQCKRSWPDTSKQFLLPNNFYSLIFLPDLAFGTHTMLFVHDGYFTLKPLRLSLLNEMPTNSCSTSQYCVFRKAPEKIWTQVHTNIVNRHNKRKYKHACRNAKYIYKSQSHKSYSCREQFFILKYMYQVGSKFILINGKLRQSHSLLNF